MCEFLSAIVLKGEPCRILHKPGVDSHSVLMTHFGVRERGSASAEDQLFARVEFVPDWYKDVSKPEAWTFKLDEVRRPVWFDADVEASVRRELWSIVQGMLHTGGDAEYVDGDHIILAGEVTLHGGRAWALGSSTVTAYGSSTVMAYDSSTVTINSAYADAHGRGPFDGKGHPILRCPLEVGKTYQIQGGEFKVKEQA